MNQDELMSIMIDDHPREEASVSKIAQWKAGRPDGERVTLAHALAPL